MKKILLTFIALSFLGCSIYFNKPESENEIIPLAIPSDTVLFKYVLGESREKIDAHTNKLLKSNTIEPIKTQNITIQEMGIKAHVEETGYPCVIYLGEDSIKALMSLRFYNDTLYMQRFYMYKKYFPFDEMTKLYGKSIVISGSPYKTPKNFYPLEEYNAWKDNKYWSIGDKAIYVNDYYPHYILYLEKMSLKIRMTNEIEEMKEMKKVVEDLIKTENKEKSKEIGW